MPADQNYLLFRRYLIYSWLTVNLNIPLPTDRTVYIFVLVHWIVNNSAFSIVNLAAVASLFYPHVLLSVEVTVET